MTAGAMLLMSVAVLLVAVAVSQAQESQQQFVHPLSDMPGPSEDIETSFVFPDFESVSANAKLPLGETITVLCHFSNDGASPVNISAIMGSLNHALDFRYHIQNYTYKPFGMVVKGGEEVGVSLSSDDNSTLFELGHSKLPVPSTP
jgi:hypothetical protein